MVTISNIDFTNKNGIEENITLMIKNLVKGKYANYEELPFEDRLNIQTSLTVAISDKVVFNIEEFYKENSTLEQIELEIRQGCNNIILSVNEVITVDIERLINLLKRILYNNLSILLSGKFNISRYEENDILTKKERTSIRDYNFFINDIKRY